MLPIFQSSTGLKSVWKPAFGLIRESVLSSTMLFKSCIWLHKSHLPFSLCFLSVLYCLLSIVVHSDPKKDRWEGSCEGSSSHSRVELRRPIRNQNQVTSLWMDHVSKSSSLNLNQVLPTSQNRADANCEPDRDDFTTGSKVLIPSTTSATVPIRLIGIALVAFFLPVVLGAVLSTHNHVLLQVHHWNNSELGSINLIESYRKWNEQLMTAMTSVSKLIDSRSEICSPQITWKGLASFQILKISHVFSGCLDGPKGFLAGNQ